MRIAVTGAAGQLGGQVAGLLAPGHDVVSVARREPPAGRWAKADYDDPKALRAAFEGAETLVFVNSDGPSPDVIRHHENIVEAAAAAGVVHIVALSGLDADLDSPFVYGYTAAITEQLLEQSGCELSIARASIYREFFGRWLTGGPIRLPAGNGRVSLVPRADVGRALAALATTGPTGRIHEITGPQAFHMSDLGDYVDITPHQYAAEAAAAGEEAWWLYAFTSMFASIREGRWATVSGDAAELRGQGDQRARDGLQ